MYTLDDICLIITDGSHFSPEDEGRGYPMLSVKDMNETDFDFSNCKHVGEESFKKLVANGCMPKLDDVVVAKDGSYLKTSFPIREERKIALLSSIAILRPNTSLVFPSYLSYFLKSESVYRTVSLNYISGTALKRIILKGIKKIPINLPELEEQKRRAALLDQIHAIIEKRKQELNAFDDLIKARFVEMFGDPFTTSNYEIKTLKEVSLLIEDGSNIDKAYYRKTGDVLFLRIQNVWFNEFRLEDSVFISDEINHRYYDTSLQHGDLLITKIGRYLTPDSSLGRVSVYLGDDNRANYSNNIMRVRLADSVNCEFINALMNLDDYNKYIRNVSVGGTDKRALSKAIIGDFPIIIPPMSLQLEYANYVHQINKTKESVQKALDKVQMLFDNLMQQYFY